jgi:hypothetical protein
MLIPMNSSARKLQVGQKMVQVKIIVTVVLSRLSFGLFGLPH